MPIETTPQPLMTPTEVARLLNVTTKTLREWRLSNPPRGPESLKLGDGKSAARRYRREAVLAWIESRSK
jgi:predicted DNA-binding transcriptional regulator AlpA